MVVWSPPVPWGELRLAKLAVILEGDHVSLEAPSLSHSVKCSLTGENKGHIPAWALSQ